MLKRILVAFVLLSVAAWNTSAWSQGKDLRISTGPIGSTGHKAMVVLAEVLNREMPNYRIAVLPTPGAVNTVKGYAMGEFQGYYGSDLSFQELASDCCRFKGFKAQVKQEPWQSFWAYTIEAGIAVHARNKDKIRKWSDLAGKRVFTGPLPFDVRVQLERALEALNVRHNYVQIDLATVGSQLESGAIDAICIYTSAESVPVPWLIEASLAADWAALNPSGEEMAKLKSKNFAVTEVKPEVFKRNTHTDKVALLPFFWGFHVGRDVPEDDVYKSLTIIEKNAAALAKSDSSFVQIAQSMPKMQQRGVQSAADLVPIHPGLAKYMREKGVWDKKWDAKVAGM